MSSVPVFPLVATPEGDKGPSYRCDCLNFCGDDPWLKTGVAQKCEQYERLHRYDNVHTDAARFRWLCEHPDWLFMEGLCRAFPGQTAVEFYRGLADEIDRRRVQSVAPLQQMQRDRGQS
jgi:hypothetical protein